MRNKLLLFFVAAAASASLLSGCQKTEPSNETSSTQSTQLSIMSVIDRITSQKKLSNAYSWDSITDIDKHSDAVVKMAADSTAEYEVYGIISPEYGTYGMILNDIIDGEDNWNYVYEPWNYSDDEANKPVLETSADGKLTFSYPSSTDSGSTKKITRIVDCGYQTGHMELTSVKE